MARRASRQKEFSLYRAQFVIEQTLFPTSANLPEKTAFVRDVFEDSAASLRYRSRQRRWVITHPRLLTSLNRNFLIGTIGYIKERPSHVYDFEGLEFKTERHKDAELLEFVFDGERELMALQKSSSFKDRVVLDRIKQIFSLANPETRQNRLLVFYPLPIDSNRIGQVEGAKVRRFIAHLRRPNADLRGQFDQYFKPLQEGNNSDEVDVTWWNKMENLSIQMSGAVRAAVNVAEGGFGSWIAWIRSGKKLRKVESSDITAKRMLDTSTDGSLAGAADAVFAEVESRVANANQKR